MASRNWPKLAEVLYQSTPPPFDHLVRLHHRVFPIPGPHLPDVQVVVFEDMNTIPDVLQSGPANLEDHYQRGTDGITTSHTDPSSYGMTLVGHNTSSADGIDGPGEIRGDDQGAEELAEYTDTDQEAANAVHREEPDKTKEALVIQKAARRHILKHIEDGSNNALTLIRQRLFKSCKATANDVHVKYRKFYLGPVPHLLVCLEWIVTRAQSMRTAIKGRRAEATLQELSDLIVEHKEMR